MAVTEAYTLSAVTVGATELSIVTGTTTPGAVSADGVYQLFLDAVTNMAKGDEFKVRIYEKAIVGGSRRVVAAWSMLGTQSEMFITPTFILTHAWDMTIQKVAGTDRAFDASIRKVA